MFRRALLMMGSRGWNSGRGRSSSTRLVLGISAGVLLAGGVALAASPPGGVRLRVEYSNAAAFPKRAAPSRELQQRRAVVRRVQAATKARFAIFRSPSSASTSTVPVSPATAMRYGANGALARKVDLPSIERGVWVVPGNDSMCIRVADVEGYGEGCTSLRAASDGHLWITLGAPSAAGGGPASRLLVGLAADGTDSVAVSSTSGTERVAVVDNVYAARVAAQPAVVVSP